MASRTEPHPRRPAGKIRSDRSAAIEAAASPRSKVQAVLARAQESGLIARKGGRISGRVSPELIERAKARTGIRSDTELVEFALANLAIDDDFADAFRALRGTVDPDLDLGF